MRSSSIAVPASFFGMILGLAGLGGDWRVAARIWSLPAWIGEIVMLVAVVVWAVLVLLYVAKWFSHREQALAELNHPIQCCFIGLFPVSTLLVALAVQPYAQLVAIALFFAGAVGTLGFSVWRHGGLWRGSRDPAS